MRQYTRDEYYKKFYDWAESNQARNLSGLTSLGSADEAGEIIVELQVNVPAANRLLHKAVEVASLIKCSMKIPAKAEKKREKRERGRREI